MGVVVNGDIGLRQFLKRTMGASSIGIAGGLVTAQVLANGFGQQLMTHHPLAVWVGGIAVAGAGILGVGANQYEKVQEMVNGVTVHSTRNSFARLMSYGLFSVGMGISMSPFAIWVQSIDPFIFPAATVLSLTTMGGCVAYAWRQPDTSLISLRAPLFGTLAGFVGLGLLSLGAVAIMGPNAFTTVWSNFDMIGGLVLFTGITAYDVHEAVQHYRNGNADHIGVATQFGIDYFNFFIRLLQIILKARLNQQQQHIDNDDD